jgi:hypothetical protein
MQGIVIDLVNHEYPGEQVTKLRELFDRKEPFEVANEMFQDLNINSIYFENIEIAGVQGYQDTIQFTLTARSIKPVEFGFNNKVLNDTSI